MTDLQSQYEKNLVSKKHSPGPWKYRPEITQRFNSMTGEKMPDRSIHWIESGDDRILLLSLNVESNASLVEAAPEMLEILKEVRSLINGMGIEPPLSIQIKLAELIERIES